MMQFILRFFTLVVVLSGMAKIQAQGFLVANPSGTAPENTAFDFQNRSIMSCGSNDSINVYSALDVQALLAIANELDTKIELTTDWNTYMPPTQGRLPKLVELNTSKWSTDVKRMLFLCVVWNETNRLNLYAVPDTELAQALQTVRDKRPWSIYPAPLAQRMDALSNPTLKDFIHIVKRAQTYRSQRGEFDKNPTLWHVPFAWRVGQSQ